MVCVVFFRCVCCVSVVFVEGLVCLCCVFVVCVFVLCVVCLCDICCVCGK